MSKYKIKQDVEKCIGCGTCVGLCPSNWKMEDDGKAYPLKKEIDKISCNQQAVDSCPVQCIEIIES